MKLVRNNTYNNDILFVDGCGSSGKMLLSRILQGYRGVELATEDGDIHIILELYNMKKITKDAMEVFLKIVLDRGIYYRSLSRNINFRIKDEMCFLTYPYPLDYIKRIFLEDKERKDIPNAIKRNNPAYLSCTQNALFHSSALFDIFSNRLRVLHIQRYPIDVVWLLWNSGFVGRIGENPTNERLCYLDGDKTIPTYTDKESYSGNQLENVIDFVYFYTKRDMNGYQKLDKKYKDFVLLIDFDELITNPIDICSQIKSLTERNPTSKLKRILKKENCPRDLNKVILEIEEQESTIRSIITNTKKLDELLMAYESFKNGKVI